MIMNERDELIRALEETAKVGKQTALASVVRVKGSAYRREGAKMVVDEDGTMTCMISGGCLEPEIAEHAKTVMANKQPMIRHLDLDEDILWGLGIGCGGTIDVYIEPVAAGPLVDAWMTALREERAVVMATAIEVSTGAGLSVGAQMLVPEDGPPLGTLGQESLDQAVVELAGQKLRQLYPYSETRRFTLPDGEWGDVFIDVNIPAPELAIFGAGHDAIPVATFGVQLGYKVTVVDARPAFATTERFPGATVIVAHPAEWPEQVRLGHRSYVVIMNHHVVRDEASLRFALESSAPYIGVLGPRSRYTRLLDDLRREGFEPAKERLAHVYNPVGLDVGAESPEEVANSILSEMLAVRRGYTAGFLRNRDGGVHAPSRGVGTAAIGS
jgi:xanthine/CO dehydrogenase XdhC/CoxF family maturation factor